MASPQEYAESRIPSPEKKPLLGSGTTMVYRDIAFQDCKLVSHQQGAKYDPSNTDAICERHVIEFESYIHQDTVTDYVIDKMHGTQFHERQTRAQNSQGNVGQRPDDTTLTPAAMASRIRFYLLYPRGDFYYYSGQNLIFWALGPFTLPKTDSETKAGHLKQPIAANHRSAIQNNDQRADKGFPGDYDVLNGPKPISCNVVWCAGYKAFKIVMTIECHKVSPVYGYGDQLIDYRNVGSEGYEGSDWPPGTTSPPAEEEVRNHQFGSTAVKPESNAVLSNRYSISESRGPDFLLTRVTQGTLIVRSYDQYATAFRHLCVPAMSKGFQRVSMEFIQSPDGLSLNYKTVDKQRYAAPPAPAIDWRAVHTENVAGYGQRGVAAVKVWLKGAPETPKALLFMAALCVIEYRLDFQWLNNDGGLPPTSTKRNPNKIIPISCELVDTLHESEIQLTMVVERTPESGTEQYGALLVGILGKLPAVNCNSKDNTYDDDNETPRDDRAKVPIEGTGVWEEGSDNNAEGARSQYNRGHWPTPLAYDSSTPAGMMAAYLQDPFHPIHAIPMLNHAQSGVDLGTTFPERDYSITSASAVENPPSVDTPSIKSFRGETNAKYPEYDTNYPHPTDSETPANTQQVSDEHKEFPYAHYEIESKYSTSQGVIATPISGFSQQAISATTSSSPPDTVCMARAHQPITTRTVFVKAIRYGKLPALPNVEQTLLSDPNGIKEYLVESQIIPKAPGLTVNQKMYEFEMEAYYKFALSRNPGPYDRLRAGRLPWTNKILSESEVTLAQVSDTNQTPAIKPII